MKRNIILITLGLFLSLPSLTFAQDNEVDETIRKEREHINKGNKFYEDKRFADAEVEYKKAIEANPNSQIGNYNLALSLIQQGGANNEEQENNPLNQASKLLMSVAQNSKSADLRSKAFYNLGNLAYVNEQYDQSIELYKNALRQNPEDDEARDNLRLAQLKKKEQEKGGGNDKNKDEKNKDQQDKKEDKKNEEKQPQQQQPQPQQMSKENMEQILQAMQNQEKETQAKVNEQKPKAVRRTGNQW